MQWLGQMLSPLEYLNNLFALDAPYLYYLYDKDCTEKKMRAPAEGKCTLVLVILIFSVHTLKHLSSVASIV